MLEKILSGVRVIDLTQNVAGPYCTQILGDLGAEIIKVERPRRGDDTRDWRPPEIEGVSSIFLALNRNKRSVCIDLKSPAGRKLVIEMAAKCDVVIHSLKPGSAEKMGLGFNDLQAVNPKLIYCALSAFGQTGPLAELPGYDPLMQAFTGIMSTLGNEGDDPVRVGVSLIDMGTGIWSALGILTGILHLHKTGEGVLVETSLLDTGVSWMTVFVASYLATQKLPKRLGSAMAMTAPYELFKSSDGYVFIAAGNDGLFARVCRGLGLDSLLDDPRFATNADRVINREALHKAVEVVTMKSSTTETVAILRRLGAPCSELHNVQQMLDSEQVKAVDMVVDLPRDDIPQHRAIALPLRMSGKRSSALEPPPRLGSDTNSILDELGYSSHQIAALRDEGAIG